MKKSFRKRIFIWFMIVVLTFPFVSMHVSASSFVANAGEVNVGNEDVTELEGAKGDIKKKEDTKKKKKKKKTGKTEIDIYEEDSIDLTISTEENGEEEIVDEESFWEKIAEGLVNITGTLGTGVVAVVVEVVELIIRIVVFVFKGPLIGLVKFVELLLQALGVNSLFGIVLGRVASGKEVSFITFELTEGNVYGIVASLLYGFMASVFIYGIICKFCTALAEAAWYQDSSTARTKLKDALAGTGMQFLILAIAPVAINVAIYIRDVLLYLLLGFTNDMVKDSEFMGIVSFLAGTGDMMNPFRARAIMLDASFADVAIYCGTVVLSVVFFIIYVSIALTTMFMVATLPYTILRGKEAIVEWLTEFVAILMTPFIDLFMLLALLLFSRVDMVYAYVIGLEETYMVEWIIMIFACTYLTIRQQIKARFGAQKAVGAEGSGLGQAFMLMQGARALSSFAKGMSDANKQRKEDAERAREAEQEDEAQKEQEREFASKYGTYAEAKQKEDNIQKGMSVAKGEDEGSVEGKTEVSDIDSEGSTEERPDVTSSSVRSRRGAKATGIGKGIIAKRKQAREDMAKKDAERKTRHGLLASTASEASKRYNKLNSDIQQKKDAIAQMQTKNASLDRAIEEAGGRMTGEGRALYEEKLANQEQMAMAREDVASMTAEKEELERDLGSMRQMLGIKGNGKGAISKGEFEKAARLQAMADVNNFETPLFSGSLTSSQLAKLRRERASSTAQNMLYRSIGAVGGAMIAGSATTFMPGGVKAMALGSGVSLGGGIGDYIATANIPSGNGLSGVYASGVATQTDNVEFDIDFPINEALRYQRQSHVDMQGVTSGGAPMPQRISGLVSAQVPLSYSRSFMRLGKEAERDYQVDFSNVGLESTDRVFETIHGIYARGSDGAIQTSGMRAFADASEVLRMCAENMQYAEAFKAQYHISPTQMIENMDVLSNLYGTSRVVGNRTLGEGIRELERGVRNQFINDVAYASVPIAVKHGELGGLSEAEYQDQVYDSLRAFRDMTNTGTDVDFFDLLLGNESDEAKSILDRLRKTRF